MKQILLILSLLLQTNDIRPITQSQPWSKIRTHQQLYPPLNRRPLSLHPVSPNISLSPSITLPFLHLRLLAPQNLLLLLDQRAVPAEGGGHAVLVGVAGDVVAFAEIGAFDEGGAGITHLVLICVYWKGMERE